MTRTALALVTLAMAAACGPGARVGASTSVAVGSAFVPPNVSSGTTTMVSYREVGGPLMRTLFTVLASNPGIDTASTSTVSYSTKCGGGYCVTTKTTRTTRYVTDSPEEVARKVAAAKQRVEALERSDIPVEFRLDFASRSLGGDTSGWMSSMMFLGPQRPMGPIPGVQLSGGLGFGKLTFHDRTRSRLTSGLMAVEEPLDEVSYSYIGIPLRLTAATGVPGLLSYVQADLNILTLVDQIALEEGESAEANPLRWGVGYVIGPARIDGELAFGRFRADAMTAMLEVSLVLP